MATRETLKEAEELKAYFKSKYNLETKIVADDYGDYDVLEVKTCRCGAEVLSAAIGEDGLDECDECYRRREQRQARVLARGIENSARRVAAGDAFDQYSEPWK